jgi:hypothetical protein
MKTKIILAFFWACIAFAACDDTISHIGLGIQPEEDKIAVFDTTIYISSSTVKTDSVYAKTISGNIGEYYNPEYGTIKAGYASQFYPSYGFFPDSMATGKIDSVRLMLFFNDFVGDSLAPMEVTVFPINKSLNRHYYSNVDPIEFCDMDNPLSQFGYMIKNSTVSDSMLKSGYYRAISIPLPLELGERFLEEYKKPEPNAFSSVEAFTEFFPGVYLENTFGMSCLFTVDLTRIHVYYQRKSERVSSSTGKDTIIIGTDYADFRVTKEVIQVNSIKSAYDESLLLENEEKTFIKAPNGVFTQISIPLKGIRETMGKKKFSGVSLSIKAIERNDWGFGLDFPGAGIIGDSETSTKSSKLLLIEPDSVKNFFEQQQVADGYTSYTTTFSTSTYSYAFSNISNLIQNAIEKAPEKDVLNLLLIPVQTTFAYQSSSYYSPSSAIDYTTSYYLFPTAVSLRKDPENMKIRILASDLIINE